MILLIYPANSLQLDMIGICQLEKQEHTPEQVRITKAPELRKEVPEISDWMKSQKKKREDQSVMPRKKVTT